ncbi:MAG: formate dehydrogenase subunit alpha, partial [Anaerovoracaceae bacterium]
LCVKGKFAFGFINHPDRLQTPLIRKNGVLEEASWDEALELIVSKINRVRQESGPEAIAGFASARCTNEENYVFQKMMRAAIGTNHVDHCARLCHASTVAGLATTLGSGAMTNSIGEAADVIFVTGSNTTEAHPVIGAKINQAVAAGAKLIVVDPREIDLCKKASIFLKIKPGTNVALLNGMIHVILERGLENKKFIETRCENYEELKAIVKEYTPERVGEICQVEPEKIIEAAILYAKAKHAPIYYSMGVTQHSTGTDGVMSVSNLALICGKIGKAGSGVNPLRGQNNVQGSCDMGCLPGDLPGYQKIMDPKVREKFEAAWNCNLPAEPGQTITEILGSVRNNDIRMLYIMGENPLISDPDQTHVEEALKACEFLVVQDIFLTETAELADVVLPAGTYAEKDGTFTNTERRVQRVRRAIPSVGDSREDFEILSEIMHRLGHTNRFVTAEEVFEEMAALTPSYGGISYPRIEAHGLQWPCPDKKHKGTPILHKDKFTRGEKALLMPITYKPSAELPDGEYPYIFSTGRVLYQYHTRTMTGKIQGLSDLAGTAYVEIHPVDAARLGVVSG